jgi:hypothetical protein
MPWRECYKVNKRLRFVARLLEGEKMAVLCREFDTSRFHGGEGEIRTPEPLARPPVFKTGAFNRSATSPR